MPINFKKPKLQKIQQFSSPSNYNNWIPGLFSENYFGNLFPINSEEDSLDQNFRFEEKNVSNFEISMNRFLLFLYCLKSNPFLFDKAGATIDYDRDEFLFTTELAEFLHGIQTNTIKNNINSSLTIELVKKYALDNLLELNPQNLSSFLDVAKTQDYIDRVSRKLNVVTYESVIKHTLYNNLKENSSFFFKEDTSSGWIDRAANLSYGDYDYFIDVEGGPDNKSFPVICVLSKSFSKDDKEKIINNSNKFLTNVFGRKVNNSCLARIIGIPNQFENNYKLIPLLKSKNSTENYYNAVCLVYDFSKVLLSETKVRDFSTHSLIECALGFLTKYKIELNNIRDLNNLKESFSSSINKYFNDDSFSKYSFTIAYKDKHSQEINSRINLEKLEEIKANISNPINIDKQDLVSSFETYINNIITEYEFGRDRNVYLSSYGQNDLKVYLHFDSFYNLLGITTRPSKKEVSNLGQYFSPFVFQENILSNLLTFDLSETNDGKTKADSFYAVYQEQPSNTVPNKEKELLDLTGHKICYITRILEKQIADNFSGTAKRIVADPKNQSKVIFKENLNLNEKINFNTSKDMIFEEDRFIDKTLEFINLSTNYRENRYQTLSFQTLNHYLYISPSIEKNLSSASGESDLSSFASLHYPVLSTLKKKEEEIGLIEGLQVLPDFEISQDILIVSQETQKAFSLLKGIFAQKDTLNINLQHYAISSLPCYADLLLLIPEFSKVKNTRDLVLLIFQLVDKLPLLDIFSLLMKDTIDKLVKLGETQQQACYPAPAKTNLTPDDLLRDLEYLKSLYYNVVSSALQVEGILSEIPRLPTIDIFKIIMVKIFFAFMNIAMNWVLSFISKKLRKYLEKFCTVDYSLLEILQDKNQVVDLGFRPKLVADSFGSVAGSGGALDTVDVNIDINTLIDLTKKATREFVYNKFADKYFINKTPENLDEISNFLYEISNAVDAFELASLLRGIQTQQTTSNLIDFIKLSSFSFKDRFFDSASIAELFLFLSEYCDYRFCYDFLANSLENYAGSICSPQNSRRDRIDAELNSLGGLDRDVNSIIRDQIFDLQKELDEICVIDTDLKIDIFKDGPRLLASSFNKVMSLPFNTVIQFQQNVLDYELGKDEDGLDLNADQKKVLGNRLFNGEKLVSDFYNVFKDDFKSVKSKYYISINIAELYEILSDYPLNITTETLGSTSGQIDLETAKIIWELFDISVKDKVILKQFMKKGLVLHLDIATAKYNIKQSLEKLGILSDYSVESLNNIVYRKFVSYPLLISEIFYNKIEEENFKDGYEGFIYNTDYLRSLSLQIEEDIKNATNLDLQDDEELLFSYIDKIKELQ